MKEIIDYFYYCSIGEFILALLVAALVIRVIISILKDD